MANQLPPIWDPSKATQFYEPLNVFQKAGRAFVDETQALGGGAVAAGATALSTVAPEIAKPALEDVQQWGLDVYNRNMEESRAGRQAPDVNGIEEIKLGEEGGLGRLANWAAYEGTKGLGTLATIAVGGGIGGAVARAATKSTVKTLAKLEAKNFAGRAAQQAAGKRAAGIVGEVGGKTLTADEGLAVAARNAEKLARNTKIGAHVGGVASTFGMEGGGSFGEIVQGGNTPEEAIGPATVAGAVNAALEYSPIYAASKALGLQKSVIEGIRKKIGEDATLGRTVRVIAGEVLKRGAVGGAIGAAAEGTTEALQEVVQIAAGRWAKEQSMFKDWTDEDWSRVANSAAVGALVGGGVGGTLGQFGETSTKPETNVELTREQEDKIREDLRVGRVTPEELIRGGLSEQDVLDIAVGGRRIDPANLETQAPIDQRPPQDSSVPPTPRTESPPRVELTPESTVDEAIARVAPRPVEQTEQSRAPVPAEEELQRDAGLGVRDSEAEISITSPNSAQRTETVSQSADPIINETTDLSLRDPAVEQSLRNASVVTESLPDLTEEQNQEPTSTLTWEDPNVYNAIKGAVDTGVLEKGQLTDEEFSAVTDFLAEDYNLLANDARGNSYIALEPMHPLPAEALEQVGEFIIGEGKFKITNPFKPFAKPLENWLKSAGYNVGTFRKTEDGSFQATISPSKSITKPVSLDFGNPAILTSIDNVGLTREEVDALAAVANAGSLASAVSNPVIAPVLKKWKSNPRELYGLVNTIKNASESTGVIAEVTDVLADSYISTGAVIGEPMSPTTLAAIEAIKSKGYEVGDFVQDNTGIWSAPITQTAASIPAQPLASQLTGGDWMPLFSSAQERVIPDHLEIYMPSFASEAEAIAQIPAIVSIFQNYASSTTAATVEQQLNALPGVVGPATVLDTIPQTALSAETVGKLNTLSTALSSGNLSATQISSQHNALETAALVILTEEGGDFTAAKNKVSNSFLLGDILDQWEASPAGLETFLDYAISLIPTPNPAGIVGAPTSAQVAPVGEWAPADLPSTYFIKDHGYAVYLQLPSGRVLTYSGLTVKSVGEIAHTHHWVTTSSMSMTDKIKNFLDLPTDTASLDSFKAAHPYLFVKVTQEMATSKAQSDEFLLKAIYDEERYTLDEKFAEADKYVAQWGEAELKNVLNGTPTTIQMMKSLEGWLDNVETEETLLAQNPHDGIWAGVQTHGGSAARYGMLVINPKTGKVLIRRVTHDFEGVMWDFSRGGSERNPQNTQTVSTKNVANPTQTMEHPLLAAKREAQEELGVNVKVIGQIATPFYAAGGNTASLYYVGVQDGDSFAHGWESTETRWVSYAEAKTLLAARTTETNKDVLNTSTGHMVNNKVPIVDGESRPNFPIIARSLRLLDALYDKSKQKSGWLYKGNWRGIRDYYNTGLKDDFPVLWGELNGKAFDNLTVKQQIQVSVATQMRMRYPVTDAATLGLKYQLEWKRRYKALEKWLKGYDSSLTPTKIRKSPNTAVTGQPFAVQVFRGSTDSKESPMGDRLDPSFMASPTDVNHGFFFTTRFAIAQEFGSKGVKAFIIAMKNPLVIDWNSPWNSVAFTAMIKDARMGTNLYGKNPGAVKRDGIVFKKVGDAGGVGDQIVIWDNNIIGSALEAVGYTGANFYQSRVPQKIENPLSMEEAEDTLSEFLRNEVWEKLKASGKVKIFEREDVPFVQGKYDAEKDEISLYLENIGNERELLGALLHEGRHARLDVILGDSLESFYADLQMLFGKGIKSAKEAFDKTAVEGALRFGIDVNRGLQGAAWLKETKRVREILQTIDPAFLVQEDFSNFIQLSSLYQQKTGLFNRLLNQIKAWWAGTNVGQLLKNAGFGPTLNEDMAIALAVKAIKDVQRPIDKETRGKLDKYYAFFAHASPINWPAKPGFPYGKIDLSKAGTGEGNINFGWGFYLLQAKDVMQKYQTDLANQHGISSSQMKLLGFNVPDVELPRMILWDRALNKQNDIVQAAILSPKEGHLLFRIARKARERKTPYPDGAKPPAPYLVGGYSLYFNKQNGKFALQKPTEPGVPGDLQSFSDVIDFLEAAEKLGQLPAELKAIYVSPQAEGEKLAAVKKLLLQNEKGTGGSFYEELMYHFYSNSGTLKAAAKKASLYLRDVGVPGTVYLDGFSRAKGYGTYNLVIWDQAVADKSPMVWRNGQQVGEIPKAVEYDVNHLGEPYPQNIAENKLVISKNGEWLYARNGQTKEISVGNLWRMVEGEFGKTWARRAKELGLIEIHNTRGPDGASGVFDKETGTLHLFAWTMPADEDPRGVLLHEGSHQTMRVMLGEQNFNRLAREIVGLGKSGNEKAKEAMNRSGVAALAHTAMKLGISHRLFDITDETELKEEWEKVEDAVKERVGDDKAISQERMLVQSEELISYYTQLAAESKGGLFRRIVNGLKLAWKESLLGKAFAVVGLEPELTDAMMVALARRATKFGAELREEARKTAKELGLVGGVTNNSADILASRPGQLWRSPTKVSLAAIQQQKGTREQWIAMLTKMKGVKEEGEDMGLWDWLGEQEGIVEKKFIEGFIEKGGVKLEETILSAPTFKWTVLDPQGNPVQSFDTEQEAMEEAELNGDEFDWEYRESPEKDTTKHMQYREFGGDNYRELLITIPQVLPENLTILKGDDGYWYVEEIGKEGQGSLAAGRTKGAALAEFFAGKTYQSSHWGEPNVLVHLRFDERNIDGKRVLFLEEVQSDWHQDGRKRGYNSEWAQQDKEKLLDLSMLPYDVRTPAQNAELSALFKKKDSVLNAPMKQTSTWAMLAIKRAARWAAENGFDSVAWATGEMNAKRYGDNAERLAGMQGFYDRLLPNEVKKWGKKFGVNLEPIRVNGERVNSFAITPELKEEALNGMMLYSRPGWLPKINNQYFYTDPLSDYVEEFNSPGLLNRWQQNYVNMFSDLDKKDAEIGRAFDLAKSKKSTQQRDVEEMLFKPFREIAAKSGKSAREIGDAFAAQHIVLDGVNDEAARVNSERLVTALIKKLPGQFKAALQNSKKDIVDKMKSGAVTLEQGRESMKNLLDTALGWKTASGESVRTLEGVDKIYVEWQKIKDFAGGFSTGKGDRAVLDAIAPERRDAFEIYNAVKNEQWFKDLNDIWAQLVSGTIDVLVDGGLQTAAQGAAMKAKYKHYAPLRRKDLNEADEISRFFGRAGNVVEERYGSTMLMEPVNVLQNAFAQRQAAIAAAEKNKVLQRFLEHVRDDRDSWDGWFRIVDKVSPKKGKNDLGFVSTKPSGAEVIDIPVIYKGKRLLIRPEEDNIRAAKISSAIQNLEGQQLNGPMQVMQAVNQWVRWTNITASPAFMAVNAPRDFFTALLNVRATAVGENWKDVAKEYTRSFKALKKVFWDKSTDETDPDVKMVMDWQRAGGRMSFVESLKANDTTWKSLSGQIARRQGRISLPGIEGELQIKGLGSTIEVTRNFLEKIETANILVENIMRFSVFKVAVNNGVSTEEAAQMSKEITTNFDRKGFKTQVLSAWFLFMNPTIQGNSQVVRNLLSGPNKKLLWKTLGGVIAASILFDMLGAGMSGDEDDDERGDWDSIPEWQKERFMIVPIPFAFGEDDKYAMIPLPWVFNTVWRFGQMLSESMRGARNLTSIAPDTLGLMLTTFNPITGGSFAQRIAPTAADPFVQIIENVDAFGNPLRPEKFPGDDRPKSQVSWSNTPEGYKWLAERVNELTGGNVGEQGAVDLYPSSYKVVGDMLLGSGGRFFAQVMQAPFKDDLEVKDIPLLKTFVVNPKDPLDAKLFHERIARVHGARRAERLLVVERDQVKLQNFREERASELRLYAYATDVERQLKALRGQLKSAEMRGADGMAKRLEKRIEELYGKFNASWERRVGRG